MISMYKANTMAPHATPRFTLLLLSLCLALMPFGLQAQDIIRLTGKVLQKGNNEPLMGVNITDAEPWPPPTSMAASPSTYILALR